MMNQAQHALLFTDANSPDSLLMSALKECALHPIRPWEVKDKPVEVSIIVIDRPAQNTAKICANLRSQNHFAATPILVVLEGGAGEYEAQLRSLNVDIIFKPIRLRALNRYISSRVSASSKTAKELAQAIKHEQAAAGHNPTNGRAKASHKSETRAQEEAGVKNRQPSNETQRLIGSQALEPSTPNQQAEPNSAEVSRVPILKDIIPTSDRLFTTVAKAGSISKGGVLCPHCRMWECRREDAVCSRCEEPLIALANVDEPISFEPHGDHCVGRLVEFNSTGQNPVRMGFSVITSRQLENRFSLHTSSAVLDAGSRGTLLITFDARGLDLNTVYKADLEVRCNEKGRSLRRIEIVVERIPRARLEPPEGCLYVIGGENEWEFRLGNEGGGSLRLSKVMLDDITLNLSKPSVIKGGSSSVVCLRIPELNLTTGKYKKKMTWEFEYHSPLMFDIEVAAMRPPRIATNPPELDLGSTSLNRVRRLSLTIINAGGEELVIKSLTTSVDWIECAVEMPLHIQPGSSRVLDVQVRGSAELVGDRNGSITIHSNSYQSQNYVVPIRLRFIEPRPYEQYIGIDFGTTASCVAILYKTSSGLQPFAIDLDQVEQGVPADPRIMPSVLYFQEDGTVSAGRAALQQAIIQPLNAVTSIKRVLGIKEKKVFAGQSFNATELASKIIEQLVLRTEDGLFQLGQYKTPRRAVITVPVEFYDNQRRALLEACKMTGLEMESRSTRGIVMDEAHAAALYYLSKRSDEGEETKRERLMIFDFGGGTLDCVLIEVERVNGKILLKTMALGGDPRLGGEDVDWALVEKMSAIARKAHQDFDIDCLGDENKLQHKFQTPILAQAALRTRAAFKRHAEFAKIALSQAASVELSISPLLKVTPTPLEPFIMNGLGPAHIKVTLEKQDLEAALAPLIERAIGVVKTACERAKAAPDSIDTVLHVGRTSLIPIVREKVNSFLVNAEDRSRLVEPKLCVALGAAFWGYIKDKPGANIEFVGGADLTIHDIGYLDFNGLKEVFVTVIPAQTRFPTEKTVRLPNTRDWIELVLAEGRGKILNGKDNYEVTGSVRIDAREIASPQIAVSFMLDENRMIQISVNGRALQITSLGQE